MRTNPPEAISYGKSVYHSDILKCFVNYWYEIWPNPQDNVIEPDLSPEDKKHEEKIIDEILKNRRRMTDDN